MTRSDTVTEAAADFDDPTRVDFADPAVYQRADLPELWAVLRRVAPVHRSEAPGRPPFWVVSRYDDAVTVFRDSERFSVEQGNMLATLLTGGDSASGRMLAVTDGARHREVRQLMARAFSPRVLSSVTERVSARIDLLIRRWTTGEDFDFAAQVAEHIPIGTICDLLDVPSSDRGELLALSKLVLSSDEGAPDQQDMVIARNEMLLYFTSLAQSRQGGTGEDVVSTLVNSFLSFDEVVLNCYSLLIGGDESSRLSSVGAVQALAQHQDQWLALRDRRATVESAVEEVLRWTTPPMHFGRRARVDVGLGDQVIRAGDAVTVWASSANRDERVFADPNRFDLTRTPNRHLTFGLGNHFCLGAYLGRVQLAALLESLRRHVVSLEQVGPASQVYSNFMYGYCQLPVRFTR